MKTHHKVWELEDKGMSLGQMVETLKMNKATIIPLMRKHYPAYKFSWIVKRNIGANDVFGYPPNYNMKIEEAREFLRKNKELEEFIMAERKFDMVKELRNGVHRTGVVIRCAKNVSPQCVKKEEFFTSTGRVSYIHAAQNFRNHGWIVGGGPRADCCKACFEYRAEAVTKPAEIIRPDKGNSEPPQVVSRPVAPAVSQNKTVDLKDIDRTIRRIIDTKLEEVYNIERGGYLFDDAGKPWNDARLAADLGCDKGWVAAVRDFAYGPETSEADAKIELEKLKALGDEIRTIKKQVEAGIERLEQYDHTVNEGLRKFEAMTKEFQQRFDRLARKLIV